MRKLTNQTRQVLDLEGCEVLSTRHYQRILCERRLMASCLGACLFGVVLFVTSVATTNWARVDIVLPTNATFCLHLGIWGEWRTDYNTMKQQTAVTWIPHFPQLPEDRPRLKDKDLPHYYRTQATFSIIALSIMLFGIFVGACSLRYHRYMYKRLAAGLMAIVAMCILVAIEVLIHSIEEWRSYSDSQKNVDYIDVTHYGFSTFLAWVVFAIYTVSSVIFLIGGRKQKGENAATQECEVEDRPINLG